VSDTGQGMTEEQISHIFDDYSQFNQEANRATEGTGLGMSITRNLVRLMNGDISVESEPGTGSTFTVRLPQGRLDSGVLGREMTESLSRFSTFSKASVKRARITYEPMPYGSVLIVDDVETNIYVAKGLLTPYELKTDSANSGFAAIEKIKNGKTYDIVFMDHMMPELDGVEATKILRGIGYDRPIVALTANAVVGQMDMFLKNGFDDFISKPIDMRQMNIILNRLVRDKQSLETIEAARQQAAAKKGKAPRTSAPQLPMADPHIAEVFMRDAKKALAALEEMAGNDGSYDNDRLRAYINHVHGIKSALANIGEVDLSAVALRLEQLANDGNTGVMASETPAFLAALRTLVEELAPKENSVADEAEEDTEYLCEKLLAIKTACEAYDESAAEKALRELRNKAWPQPVKELLGSLSLHLLHSDFAGAESEVEAYLAHLT